MAHKIYTVETQLSYEPTLVHGYFFKRKNAEKFCAEFNRAGHCYDAEVVEHDMEDEP